MANAEQTRLALDHNIASARRCRRNERDAPSAGLYLRPDIFGPAPRFPRTTTAEVKPYRPIAFRRQLLDPGSMLPVEEEISEFFSTESL
jgi:hypothetical protein